jgi:hypothetical protein
MAAAASISIVVPSGIAFGSNFVLPINVPLHLWSEGDYISLCKEGNAKGEKDCWYNVFGERRERGSIEW